MKFKEDYSPVESMRTFRGMAEARIIN